MEPERAGGAVAISAIIPTFNAEEHLGKCLNALYSSTYQPLEVIVVDDASTDASRDIALRHGAKLVPLSVNLGAGAARNVGSKAATGDILLFVDSDVIVGEDSLQLIASHLELNLDVAAVTGIVSKRHPESGFFTRYKNLYMNAIFSRLPQQVEFVYGGIFAVRSGQYLGMCEERMLGEDTELGFRMSRTGRLIHLLHDLEVVHLKTYSLRTLLVNDFFVPFHFARTLVRHSGYTSLVKKRRFSHTSGRQVISVLISFLLPPLLIAGFFESACFIVALLLTAVLFGLNLDLFRVFWEEMGALFAIRAVAFTYLDTLVMSCGTLWGALSALIGPRGNAYAGGSPNPP